MVVNDRHGNTNGTVMGMTTKSFSMPVAHGGQGWCAAVAGRISRLVVVSLILGCLLAAGDVSAVENGLETSSGESASIAQRNLRFFRIGRREGLSQASVNAIVQDNLGYIWIGTQEGLNRFDGYEMEVFEHDPADPGSLSRDWVWSVYVDRDGTLWVGTDGGGLERYDREKHAFDHYQHDQENPNSLSSNRIRAILEDSQGIFWIGTDGGGLDRLDPKTGRFTHFRHDKTDPQSLPGNKVLALFEDINNTLWVGTDKGLARFHADYLGFEIYRHQAADSSSISNNDVRVIYEDNQRRFWVGTYKGGLNLFDRKNSSFKHFQHDPGNPSSLGHNWVRDIFQDREGTLWVATDGGLNELRPETGSFVHYTHDPSNPATISNDQISSLFQDRGNVLWIGTFNGLNTWNYVSDAFNYLQLDDDADAVSEGKIITSLAEGAGDQIWVGSYGDGLVKVDRRTGNREHFLHNENDPFSLSDDRIMSLFAEQDGSVWVGTFNGGLNHLDPQSGKFGRYRHDPMDSTSISSNAVTTIYRDKQNTLWVGTYGGGLNRYYPERQGFRVYRHNPEDDRSISSDRVLAIYQDHANVLWVGTEDGGLNRFDPVTGSFTRYQHDPHDPSSLSSNAAWNIMEGWDGSLWVATMGGGLNRWSLADRKVGRTAFRKYQKSDGLESNTIYAVLEDREGALWLSSNRGLSRLNPANGRIQGYDRFNGLKGDEFTAGAYLKTRAGQLYFGGADGVLTFNPESLTKNLHQPQIVLSVRSRDQLLETLASNDTEQKKGFVLGYNDDYVTFGFTALDFASPHMNQYKYRLEGFDKDWIEVRKQRSATYTSLPAGEYVFSVMASNNDGVWNETGVSVPFTVELPPWQTSWAFTLYALVIGGLLFSYKKVQDRKQQIVAEHSARLEALVDVRTRELSERNEQLKRLNEKLKEVSVTDSLTGLKNRRYLYEFIESRVAAVNRRTEDTQKSKTLSQKVDITPSIFFIMIDLDGFKTINDTYGHAAGDQVLIQVRDTLRASCRESDIIIRWGGDEFLIVGENNNVRAAEQLAERIRRNLVENQYQIAEGLAVKLSGSIGFSMYPFSIHGKADLLSWEQVIAIADHAAYTAKKNGRNAWVGIYGTRHSSWNDFAKSDLDLVELAATGRISLSTSLDSLSKAAKTSLNTGA
jgi:diguanylate cyclase (GGDEF)-like protein